jgi:hypothetical protein
MRNISDKICRENQTHFMKLCCLSDGVKKYGTAEEDAGNNIMQCRNNVMSMPNN